MTTVKSAAMIGAGPCRPLKSLIRMDPRRFSMKPMIKKKPIVMTPWLNINKTAPTVAMVDPDITPKVMKPIWASEEYATNRFRSGVVQASIEP